MFTGSVAKARAKARALDANPILKAVLAGEINPVELLAQKRLAEVFLLTAQTVREKDGLGPDSDVPVVRVRQEILKAVALDDEDRRVLATFKGRHSLRHPSGKFRPATPLEKMSGLWWHGGNVLPALRGR